MPILNINGADIDVPNGITLLQACEMAGAEIPRFCYHERLSIAGNCRMCLVEWVGAPKPQASCALSVNDLRPNRDGTPPNIRTDSALVKKAREGVMEFLLINHPLDCPICDQGGECDLQDQAMAYGIDKNRFIENKRSVEDKYIGPLVKTIMTRCIHCTRCIRFSQEVAGVPDLGAIGRGEDMEITTYLEKAMGSELQGNVIDLCPVGALTSKPYAFSARPWELNKTESIDVMDAIGSNIRVDSRGREVMRIMPRANESVNEEWISDKTRFIWDGLKTQRLDRPFIRKNGKLTPASWAEALTLAAEKLNNTDKSKIAGIAGDLCSAEELFAFKGLMDLLGVDNLDCRQDCSVLSPEYGRSSYLFNAGIAGIDEADAILLIGSNPRKEAAVLNARIRKRYLQTSLPIAAIGGLDEGEQTELLYDFRYLGASPESLSALLKEEDKFFNILKKAEKPLIIVGQGALTRTDGNGVLATIAKLAIACGAVNDQWNGLSILHTAASRVAGLELDLVPSNNGMDTKSILDAAEAGQMDIIYLLGADEIPTERLGNSFVIYQGSHGDRGAHRADIILPGATYTEKSGLYVNTEGRVQLANRATFPPGEAREDWAILRALSQAVGKKLPYDSLLQLRQLMIKEHPELGEAGQNLVGKSEDIETLAKKSGRMNKAAFSGAVSDFYMNNAIARSSAVMAECSALTSRNEKGTGTNG